jgi:hypothetical protein
MERLDRQDPLDVHIFSIGARLCNHFARKVEHHSLIDVIGYAGESCRAVSQIWQIDKITKSSERLGFDLIDVYYAHLCITFLSVMTINISPGLIR